MKYPLNLMTTPSYTRRSILGIVLLLLTLLTTWAVSAQDTETILAEIVGAYDDDIGTGIVAFVDDNGTHAVVARGIANIDTRDAVDTTDYFRIGSATKPMVAVAVLMLADEGEIDLDAPIVEYIPAELLTDIANADTATVRQVLQMTSGIYSYTESEAFDDAVAENPAYGWTARELLPFVQGEAPYFAPGEGYYYSNTNYILAEILIEEVGQVSLAEALRDWIFAPLGMDTCYVETPDIFAQQMVRGYTADEDGTFIDITEENDGVGLGDGGVVCTAVDMAKFLPALANGELLSDERLVAMLETVDDGEGGAYGLGIGYDEGDFGVMLSHDGATSGFQSTMLYLPDEGISVVVLTNNFDSEIVASVADDVLFALFEGE